MKLTAKDRLRIKELMRALREAFPWELTQEGFEYWDRIYETLKDKLEKGEY